MHSLLLFIHSVACVLLILMVLLQAGRGAGFAMFGGGGDTLFASPGGSSALKKATIIFATTFAITSLMLTLISSRPGLQSVTGRGLALPPGAQPKAAASAPKTQAPKEDTGAPMALPEEAKN